MYLISAMGIPGMLVILMFAVLFMQMCLEELKLAKGSHMRPAISGGFTAIAVLSLYGIWMPVFSDIRLVFLFWLVVGLAAAYRRVSAERRDDRALVRRRPMEDRSADIIVY